MIKLELGTILREERKKTGRSADALAEKAHCSGSLVRKIEQGQRGITKEMRRHLARALDQARFYKALQREATGGVMALSLANIENHRLVARDYFLLELEEAGEAVRGTPRLWLNPLLTEPEKTQARGMFREVIQAIRAAETFLCVVSDGWDISLADLYDEVEQENIDKEYPEKRKRPNGAQKK